MLQDSPLSKFGYTDSIQKILWIWNWKEGVVEHFKVLFQHFPRGNEENQETHCHLTEDIDAVTTSQL